MRDSHLWEQGHVTLSLPMLLIDGTHHSCQILLSEQLHDELLPLLQRGISRETQTLGFCLSLYPRCQEYSRSSERTHWWNEWLTETGGEPEWERGTSLRLGVKEGSWKRAFETVPECCQWGSLDTHVSVNPKYKSLTKNQHQPMWKITGMDQVGRSELPGADTSCSRSKGLQNELVAFRRWTLLSPWNKYPVSALTQRLTRNSLRRIRRAEDYVNSG